MAALSDEQVMLRDMAAGWARERMPVTAYRHLFEGKFPSGFDPAAYAEMAGMGWAGIVVPEAYGGVDFGYLSFGLVVEELGRTLAASPLIGSALVAATALRLGGSEAQKQTWLARIADGSAIGALALEEGGRHDPAATALRARPQGIGWVLDGIKRPVPDGASADVFVVVARTGDDVALFLVPADASGLGRETLDQIDARAPALLRFDGVQVDGDALIAGGGALLEKVLDAGRAGLAAEMLGSAVQSFETTLDYLKTRVQFGQLIGSFQALQHRAGAMFGELQLLRSAVEAALAALDAGDAEAPKLVSLAKALAGDTLYRVSNEMVQLHGGIGMTHEHDAGLYLKRARVADQMYGNAAFHRERALGPAERVLSSMKSREIRLMRRPAGVPVVEDFAEVEVTLPPPGDGEVQVRNLWMAVDPAMRGRMSDAKSYVPPFGLDEAMQGPAIGEVVASNDPGFAAGDLVFSRLGWREGFNAPAAALEHRDRAALPPQAYLGFAGSTGLTAYAGLLRIASLRPGDVVFVSAASGGVGSIACQIARIKGHKVIGAAGGARKAAFLRDVLKLDGVIDYKAEASLTKALAREVKAIGAGGIDVYFDNVGGDHLQAALALANSRARFAICGMISQYNVTDAPTVPRNLTQIMVKSLKLEGYIVLDHMDLMPHFMADVTAWHRAGLLEQAETVHEGIGRALTAFDGLFSGENLGRTLVRLG